jgi:transposase
MSATHVPNSTPAADPTLYLAFELGWNTWKLAFTTGIAQSPRTRSIPARDLESLQREIHQARKRFGLSDQSPLITCFEAGRDGFWLNRYLNAQEIHNIVVDASSIEVNRRKRRAKTDRLDAAKLVSMLIRWHGGERKLWSIVNVPTPEQEDLRQPHRELTAMKAERTMHSNAIKGLLANLGLDAVVDHQLPQRLDAMRQWNDAPVPPGMRQRVLRTFERWQFVDRQIRDLENEQRRSVRRDDTDEVKRIRMLLDLKGVGMTGATLLVREFFGWRRFSNRRQVTALAGLSPMPYQSGDSHQEQGISKAGNRRVRWIMVELAWMWLRYQPQSALSQWYMVRFGAGGPRMRKVGIVALARKLLIAFWKYLEQGEVPDGAEFTPWRKKLNGRLSEEAA